MRVPMGSHISPQNLGHKREFTWLGTIYYHYSTRTPEASIVLLLSLSRSLLEFSLLLGTEVVVVAESVLSLLRKTDDNNHHDNDSNSNTEPILGPPTLLGDKCKLGAPRVLCVRKETREE